VAPRRGTGDKPTRSLPRGLVPLPHTGCGAITNGQATRPFRVKIVTWGQDGRRVEAHRTVVRSPYAYFANPGRWLKKKPALTPLADFSLASSSSTRSRCSFRSLRRSGRGRETCSGYA
jgi:hypothetical protein